MNGYQAVFQRYESKYLLSQAQYEAFLRLAADRIQADDYTQSTVCSVYYDTSDMRLIRTSLDGPVYKEKLRLRSYGVPGSGSPVFVELKKKYRGIVYKRRIELPLETAEGYLRGACLPEQTQIRREIDRFLAFYAGLAPRMYISYSREAYCGGEHPQLRLTFDCDIRFRTQALSLAQGTAGTPLLEGGQVLLELKTPDAIPLPLARLLGELEIYPCSFSKYGQAYLRCCTGGAAEERRGQTCRYSAAS